MTEQDAAAAFEHVGRESTILGICSTIAFVLLVVSSAVLWWAGFRTTGAFRKMFADMGTPLPVITAVAMSPLFQMILPALAVAGLVKEVLIRNRAITLALNALHFCFIMALTTIYMQALVLPLVELMRQMSSAA